VSDFHLKSSQFRRERQAAWLELEAIVDMCDRYGIREVHGRELLKLATLYRHAVASLATARAISLDRNVVEYLEVLIARAHLYVYGFRQTPREAAAGFFARSFPRAVRRYFPAIAASIALLLLGIGAGAVLVAQDAERYYDIVDAGRAQGRTPAATTTKLRRMLYDTGGEDALELPAFATWLFTNNARVGLWCAASGLAAGTPIPPLLGSTGLELGAMAELYRGRGLGLEFWAWILPHGVTELLAVCLCAAAGLSFGLALVFPGGLTRRDAMERTGREVAVLVLGAVLMFVLAGVIEGIFRQTIQSPAIRWSVAALSLIGWPSYFAFAGRRDAR
jgi:uncharacterized membrane protein SpoIIM required for sporulation